MSNDHKLPKLTNNERQLLAFIDERMLNLVNQIRAVAIAAGITPEKFWDAFVNDEAQDKFYIRLHAAQDIFNLKKQNENKPNAPNISKKDKKSADKALAEEVSKNIPKSLKI